MDETLLQPDCARCTGLCCVALAVDAGERFAFDKPAGEPCRHLRGDHSCKIHDRLAANGMSGCVAYDCLGAGQRVSQEVFPGRSWRDGPEAARAIFAAFAAMRRVHQLLQLLSSAARLDLTPAQRARRAELEAALNPPAGWTEADLQAFARGDQGAEVRAFLSGLKAAAAGRRPAA